MNNNSYLIESIDETRRLDLQSKISVYNIDLELEYFNFNRNDITLDAGCGTGHLIKKLIEKNIRSIHALDFSKERLEEIKNKYISETNKTEIKLIHADVTDTKIKNNTYDRIVSRYLYEHLREPEQAVKEMYRILKHGGEYNIINFDDIFFGFETKNERFNANLKKLKQSIPYDFNIAKKLPQLLRKHGFTNVFWQAQTYFFKGEELALEKENNRMRLHQAKESFKNFFDASYSYDQFAEDYLNELDDECNVNSTTKFLIRAIK